MLSYRRRAAVQISFLREALHSEAAADKLRRHEHAISVALSQVDYAEAPPALPRRDTAELDQSPHATALRKCASRSFHDGASFRK